MDEIKINNSIISFSDNCVEIIKLYKDKKPWEKESGGILLGQIVKNKIFIKRMSLPSKFDKATKTSFFRNKDVAQVIVDFEFINSNKKTIYLGEWHTHHENFPTPSKVDFKMIGEQFKKNVINTNELIMMIIGSKNIYIGLYNGSSITEEYCKTP